MQNFKGYRTYAVAFATMLVGLIGTIDPGTLELISKFLGEIGIPVSTATLLLAFGLIMAGLRKITESEQNV